MARVAWTVKQVKRGDFDGPELARDYRSQDRVSEPKIGDVLVLPDGPGPWRVVDWMLADRHEQTENVLVVELVVDSTAVRRLAKRSSRRSSCGYRSRRVSWRCPSSMQVGLPGDSAVAPAGGPDEGRSASRIPGEPTDKRHRCRAERLARGCQAVTGPQPTRLREPSTVKGE